MEQHKIETIPFELTIVGKGYRVKTNEAFQTISSLWDHAKKDGFMQKLIDLSWERPKCTLEGLLGVCGKEAKITDEEFIYFMGIRYDGEAPNDMQCMTISHDTWAVISNVTEAWKQLYEWLPSSQYELADAPCIECYYAPNHLPESELWVPVIRK
ncbi:GyrI-like domain-containing protein [Anoxybacillus suryakundensis]|uniref:Predicted transcriptional regulator YdeE, contains AraC-type DNA-binding domain n=1 Tax=Anoxybacillus suryakundensis TaxID=1325335 RepID=A0A0K6GQC3_9BACL|nr:GyrI-like domain-containing protein [Anoxybacillus suryakundensis]CUA80696.1 Predicted transcriptional regulator YdeE, contains AraC-type DNA-binding domain [Anoxybacillus suryakundensis]